MSVVILNFAKCRSAEEIHKAVKKAFAFPGYYGENLDAFHDCLCELQLQRINIHIRGLYNLTGPAKECGFGILNVIKDVHRESRNIKYKIIS